MHRHNRQQKIKAILLYERWAYRLLGAFHSLQSDFPFNQGQKLRSLARKVAIYITEMTILRKIRLVHPSETSYNFHRREEVVWIIRSFRARRPHITSR